MMLSKQLHLCFLKLKYTSAINLSQPSAPGSTGTNSNSMDEEDDDDNDDDLPPPPTDFASVFASQRFFFSYPGTSNSIIDSSHTNNNNNNNINNNTFMIPRGCVKVPTYSLDPYIDFLRSMHEMVHSRQLSLDDTKDWDYLHHLLLCYLHLNPEHTHNFILRAFSDLVLHLLSSSSSSSSSSPS